MKKLISLLEDNYVAGVLIEKGNNTLTNQDFEKISNSPLFKQYVKFGHIILEKETEEVKKAVAEDKPNFDEMSYEELKTYVKEHNIETPSMKKADILATLKA